jgi:hypothetical protein
MAIEESALVVVVPEAEDLVGPWRSQFDRASSYGVPAHVTVLYPFVPPRLIDRALTNQLRALFGGFCQFDFSLVATRRFDNRILYLAPSPEEAFHTLTRSVVASFPDYPPYEGKFEEVVAHLTVADHAPLEQLDRVEAAVKAGLPVPVKARRVSLLVGRDEPGTWHVREDFALGSRT